LKHVEEVGIGCTITGSVDFNLTALCKALRLSIYSKPKVNLPHGFQYYHQKVSIWYACHFVYFDIHSVNQWMKHGSRKFVAPIRELSGDKTLYSDGLYPENRYRG